MKWWKSQNPCIYILYIYGHFPIPSYIISCKETVTNIWSHKVHDTDFIWQSILLLVTTHIICTSISSLHLHNTPSLIYPLPILTNTKPRKLKLPSQDHHQQLDVAEGVVVLLVLCDLVVSWSVHYTRLNTNLCFQLQKIRKSTLKNNIKKT